MKRLLLFSAGLAVLTLLGFDFAGGVDSFTARPDGDGITLEWQSQVENGLKSYAIERSDIRSTSDFQEVGTVTANGNYSYYKFHDSHVSSAPLAGHSGGAQPLSDAFKYRLRLNLSSGDISYSQTVSVTKPSSGVRRTWGMIKEMFH